MMCTLIRQQLLRCCLRAVQHAMRQQGEPRCALRQLYRFSLVHLQCLAAVLLRLALHHGAGMMLIVREWSQR